MKLFPSKILKISSLLIFLSLLQIIRVPMKCKTIIPSISHLIFQEHRILLITRIRLLRGPIRFMNLALKKAFLLIHQRILMKTPSIQYILKTNKAESLKKIILMSLHLSRKILSFQKSSKRTEMWSIILKKALFML